MKFIYIYSNNSKYEGKGFDDKEIFEIGDNNFIFHSKEISKKTINKEKKDYKFLHILKKHANVYSNYYSYYASYCI